MSYWSIWNTPEKLEEEADMRRLSELYPLMARRLRPYVEEVCAEMEYPGSMMYDEYPDQLSLMKKSHEIWNLARKQEEFQEPAPEWEQVQDLIGVLLLQEMLKRRKKQRMKGFSSGTVSASERDFLF